MPRPRGNRYKQQEVLSQRPTFEEGHIVARVLRACGENIYEVEDGTGAKSLYQLPKRMRHVAFIRRGSYVFVRNDNTRREGKIRGEIEVVVMDRFLDLLRAEPFWPNAFAKGTHESASSAGQVPERNDNESEGEEFGDGWEIGSGNPNRRKWDHIESNSDTSNDDLPSANRLANTP